MNKYKLVIIFIIDFINVNVVTFLGSYIINKIEFGNWAALPIIFFFFSLLTISVIVLIKDGFNLLYGNHNTNK